MAAPLLPKESQMSFALHYRVTQGGTARCLLRDQDLRVEPP